MIIQFPILNISLSTLSSQDLEETQIGDLWDCPNDNSIFEGYYKNQKYVDHSGCVFKIIGKRKSNFYKFNNEQTLKSAGSAGSSSCGLGSSAGSSANSSSTRSSSSGNGSGSFESGSNSCSSQDFNR